MKKIIYTIAFFITILLINISCDKVKNVKDPNAETIVGNRKVFVEDYTGHKCGNCPAAADTLNYLKSQGYKIVATTPHEKSQTINELPVDTKIALVFGTEIDGISPIVYEQADEFVKIPMYGFTESFNVSVCAALCLYELTKRSRPIVPNYFLNSQEKLDIYFDWLKNSVEYSEALIKKYLSNRP